MRNGISNAMIALLSLFLGILLVLIIQGCSGGSTTIGNGKVGKITNTLREAFHEFVKTDEQIPYIG